MRYTINHAYRSFRDGQNFGPWEPGEQVELDDDVAAWLERDSPGLLTEAEVKGAERQAKPAPNRQAKGGANR